MEENKLNTEVNEEKYTYDEILKAVNNLPVEKKNVILCSLKMSELLSLLNAEGHMEKYCEDARSAAKYYLDLATALWMLADSMDKQLKDAGEEFSAEYDKLPSDTKKKVVLDLMNNTDFQTNCCEVLVKDYERIVQSNELVGAIDKLFGISKYYKKCIETGIGCDHKYEV